MKKYLFGIGLLFIFVLVPAISQAATLEEIQVLQDLVASFQAQLRAVQNTPHSCPSTPTALKLGSRGREVTNLQGYLMARGYLFFNQPTAYPTDYFGLLTQAAVIQWQEDNNIYPADGIYDPVDIEKLGEVCGTDAIKVLSPNNDGVWVRGTVQTITWQDKTPVKSCGTGVNCTISNEKFYDIKLVPNYRSCNVSHSLCQMFSYVKPYVLAIKGVNLKTGNFSLPWTVGESLEPSRSIPDGLYIVQVCEVNSDSICDSSDSYVEIVSKDLSQNQNISIDSVSGPTTLAVGQTGTWQVNIVAPTTTNINYSVDWAFPNDSPFALPSFSKAVNKSTTGNFFTFSHAYPKAGTYTVNFYFDNGIICFNYPCAARLETFTSLTVEVTDLKTPTITLLSPNGRETWEKGTVHTIKWQDMTSRPGATSERSYSLKLIQDYPPCHGVVCPVYPYLTEYWIASEVNAMVSMDSYNWSVGKVLDTNELVPGGRYTIKVCRTDSPGAPICDSSDNYFNVGF